jgi:hypothetical protein
VLYVDDVFLFSLPLVQGSGNEHMNVMPARVSVLRYVLETTQRISITFDIVGLH